MQLEQRSVSNFIPKYELKTGSQHCQKLLILLQLDVLLPIERCGARMVWFQNRRAKYRKQEKQLQKALAGTPSVLPTCNGAMMRNMYPTATRGYQPYPGPNAISTFNTMNRYPQMSSSSYPGMSQPFSMTHPTSNMAAMRQDSMTGMATEDDWYKKGLASPCFSGLQTAADEDWYKKSLTALSMNTTHHPNLSAPMLQYQT
ncbi:uncharacterized protein [Palaemon carinicauda]|uniref:uncharacterized protein n=1 Tax=Palaemon carinicauda TaxID=392227 RepID=UPI0035B5A2F6